MVFVCVTTFEFFLAILTRPAEFYFMVLSMVSQLIPDFETFATDITDVSIAGGMRTFVLFQGHQRSEAFSTALKRKNIVNLFIFYALCFRFPHSDKNRSKQHCLPEVILIHHGSNKKKFNRKSSPKYFNPFLLTGY